VNRTEWQLLATGRLRDARALLVSKRWSAAYYLAGYAVECGLKACLLALVSAAPEILFEDRRFSEKCWTHNLVQLVEVAGIKSALDAELSRDKQFRDNWDVAKDWSEASRYVRTAKARAEELYAAIAEKKHGVLSWLKKRW
jgi:hypothetical protein